MSNRFGRALTADFAVAGTREWLVTNGIGGFASGTVAGAPSRSYHGFLMAALRPPGDRVMLAPHLEATVEVDGVRTELGCTQWADGTLAPSGHRFLSAFELDGTIPVWTWTVADATLERRVWMDHGINRTLVVHRFLRGRAALRITLNVFADDRALHTVTHAGETAADVTAAPGGVGIQFPDARATLYVRADRGDCTPRHTWYRDVRLDAERARGLDDRTDMLLAASFHALLEPGEAIAVALADAPIPPFDAGASQAAVREREATLLDAWVATTPAAPAAPPAMRRLVLAADAFVVRRPLPQDPDARSIIAGYHWFGDWGRDTAIALPGLTLATGRAEIARDILLAFTHFIDGGMLPNTFPDGDTAAEYHTVDAALWYVEAVRRYVAATRDLATAERLLTSIEAIVAWYQRGTRYGIAVDPNDGLLRAGEPGSQLTWMDARRDGVPVTPRVGKPVEINALWWRALVTAADLAREFKRDGAGLRAEAAHVANAFARFVDPATGGLYDVVDGPDGDDAAHRPNAIVAVALGVPLPDTVVRTVVDRALARLWTPRGLRTLDPVDSRYVGVYGGTPSERDGAYHQGTVWPWLLGAMALAHHRAYGDARAARALLGDPDDALGALAVGSIYEVASGDAPHAPGGAVAQAWSVAELLRAWHELDAAERASSFAAPISERAAAERP